MLAGILFDDRGYPMTPKHCRTRKLYYRYYTSQAIIGGTPHLAGSLPNIPAHEIERLVQAEIVKFFKDEKQLQPWLQGENLQSQKILLQAAQNLGWENADEERLFLKSIIRRIELSDKAIKIELCGNALIPAIRGELGGRPGKDDSQQIILTRPVKLAATNNGSKVIIGSTAAGRNAQLVKAIVRSFLWNEQLISGEKRTIREIADQEKISSPTYVSKVIHLRFLAPDIIESIIEGTQPVDWTVEKLFAIKTSDWQSQRQILGLI